MDIRLLAGLSVVVGLIAACVSIACLIRIEDLHREFLTSRPRGGRRSAFLRGRGKVVRLHSEPPQRR